MALDNPILNSPFRAPDKHWQLDEGGGFTQLIELGRRRSQYFVPIARTARRAEQGVLNLDEQDETGRSYTSNDLVNEIRSHVETWRQLPSAQWGVTHETGRLLEHWRTGATRPPLFFCQIEAAETVIWFEEVAAKQAQHKALRDK